MLYNKDCSYYYIKLIHLLSDDDIWISLYNKRKLDKKVIELVNFLKKIEEEYKNASKKYDC